MFYSLLLLALLYVVIRLSGLLVNVKVGSMPLVIPVMFAGAIGGSFSSLLRLQKLSLTGNAVINLWKLDSLGVSAVLAPFVGALSASLLLLLFAGQFVTGTAFPKYR